MLLYIAIVFPFRISFVSFRLRTDNDLPCQEHEERDVVQVWEAIVTVFFYFDLLLNFFLSYRRKDGTEETRFGPVCAHYLQTFFFLNLLACLPPQAVTPIISLMDVDPGGCDSSAAASSTQATRLVRLQRVTRLARLARLVRIVKVVSYLKKAANSLNLLRGFRIVNSFVCLLWVSHIMACGWYLVAAMHSNHEDTWVGRRVISDSTGEKLLTASDVTQWIHSVYFILTVFTTVGFGDMSAVTTGEIVYVIIVMLVGAVVHSIILGEVINVVGEVDRETEWKQKQLDLLDAFGVHASLSDRTLDSLTDFVQNLRTRGGTYDRGEMREFFTSVALPRKLLVAIPNELFKGQLIKNTFVSVASMNSRSPRLVVLLATMLLSQPFKAAEVVFQKGDYAFNIYLVMAGTFAMVTDMEADAREKSKGSHGKEDAREKSKGSHGNWKAGASSAPSSHTKSLSDIVTMDPDEAERAYSSFEHHPVLDASPPGRRRTLSRLEQSTAAWTSNDDEQEPWLQMDLGQVLEVRGVVLLSHPLKQEWVTHFKVSVKRAEEDGWTELPGSFTGCSGQDHRAQVSFTPHDARFVRVLPTSWRGRCSARAGVVARSPPLFPYMLFGKCNFFGHEMVTGSRRLGTMRCEQDGDTLLLHKRDLLADGSGGQLLKEFPAVGRVLRDYCARWESSHARALARMLSSQCSWDVKAFAAATIQKQYRGYKNSLGPPQDSRPSNSFASIAQQMKPDASGRQGNEDAGSINQSDFERVLSFMDKLSNQMNQLQGQMDAMRNERPAA